MTGGWRKFHNEDLYNLYPSAYQDDLTNKDEMAEARITNGRDETCVQTFVQKPVAK
jgi:hypothetical protein